MNFKVKGQLTNVRPAKTEVPELTITTTGGTMRINAPAAKLMDLTAKDYITVVPAEENGQDAYYLTKGHAGNADSKTPQLGSILAASNKGGSGSLGFGSGNAWKELGGNDTDKFIYSISETPVEDGGNKYYRITASRKEPKVARKSSKVSA